MRLDDTAVQVANRTTEAGAVTGVVGWLASVNWIGWFGVMIALGGFAANIYFQRKRDKREQAESEARLQALKDRCGL
ncbi:MAG: holin [Plesiomonas shigelloides]